MTTPTNEDVEREARLAAILEEHQPMYEDSEAGGNYSGCACGEWLESWSRHVIARLSIQPSTEPPPCDDPAGHLAALCNCYLEAEGAWHEFVNLVYRLIPDGDIRGSIIGAAARLSSHED